MAESLHFLDGPRAGEAKVLENWESVIIGRSGACDVRLDDPSVASVHCTIERRGLVFQLSDLDGSSGTTVNGKAIRSKYLMPDDVIGVGGFRIQFKVSDAGDPSRTSVALDMPIGPEKILATARRIEHKLSERLRAAGSNATQSASRGVMLLARVSAVCIAQDDRAALLTESMTAVRDLLPCDRGVVVLRGDDGRLTAALALRGADDPPKSQLQVHRPALDRAADEGTATAGQAADRAYLCVPVQAGERLLGAIYVDSPVADRAYGEDEIPLLAAVGRQLGLALQREEGVAGVSGSAREAELREREMRQVFDALDAAVLAVAVGGTVVLDNALARELAGELTGAPFLPCVDEAGRDAVQKLLDDGWGGFGGECATAITAPEGTRTPVLLRVLPLRLELDDEAAGTLQRTLVVLRPAEG